MVGFEPLRSSLKGYSTEPLILKYEVILMEEKIKRLKVKLKLNSVTEADLKVCWREAMKIT